MDLGLRDIIIILAVAIHVGWSIYCLSDRFDPKIKPDIIRINTHKTDNNHFKDKIAKLRAKIRNKPSYH